MLAAGTADPAMTDDGIAHLASGLLFAGHGSTVAVIDRGILLPLTHNAEREALRRNPTLATPAVEEILRFPSPLQRPPATPRRGLPPYTPVALHAAAAPI